MRIYDNHFVNHDKYCQTLKNFQIILNIKFPENIDKNIKQYLFNLQYNYLLMNKTVILKF